MKASTKANETSRPKPRPIQILAGAGNLRAMMWKKNGRWKVAIVREDPATGKVGELLTPADIVSLAELTTLIAQALHDHADLDDVELSDDLGCLGHNLAKLLGIAMQCTESDATSTIQ